MEEIFLLFILPIMTNVISYYTCKLLDRYFTSGYLRNQINKEPPKDVEILGWFF